MSALGNSQHLRASAALNAYGHNVAQAAHWMDPSWSATLLGADATQLAHWRAALAHVSASALGVCSRALVRAALVAPPGLDVLMQPALLAAPGTPTGGGARPNAALLDVLPPETGLQVLRMRALSFRRAEVRRLIDKRSRMQLSEWTGVSVDRLTQDAHLADAPDITRLTARAAMPPLTALDAQTLCIEGCGLLLRDLGAAQAAPSTRAARKAEPADGGAAPIPFPLLRLALPRVLPAPAWLAAVPETTDSLGTARLFARLSDLLPEFAWLFG
jgi:type III secretion system HrpB4-like protein